MDEETELMFEDDEEDAMEEVMAEQHADRYGSVPGLDDSELADVDELERQVMIDEWGPVLALPVEGRSGIRGTLDESGRLDYGAFATVDFERTMPEFDKVRYKADKLREQLKDITIRIGIVKERLPGKAKYMVLKSLKMGVIELEQIANVDMQILARLYLRAKRLRDEIWRLDQACEARQRRRMTVLLAD